MTVLTTTSFTDLDTHGAYADAIAGDEQWMAFRLEVMADPTADLMRTGLYLGINS